MSDDPKDDRHESFEDSGFGIGQLADGQIDSFPLSELPARLLQQKQQEEETTYAIDNSDPNGPVDDLSAAYAENDDEEDDLSDLDELDDIL